MSTLPMPAVRDAIRSMRAYALEPRSAEVKLDQNESPFDLPRPMKDEVIARVVGRGWNRYPDFEATRIRGAIAAAYELAPDNILAGNGSNELLFAAIATLVAPGSPVIVPSPSFTLYEKLIAIAGGRAIVVPLDPASGRLPVAEMLERVAECEAPPLVIVCSPNNPTGGALVDGELEMLLGSGATVLLDRAYGDFAHDALPTLDDRLVVLSTFSKAWGLAALRVGWLASTAAMCREIRKVKLPYNLNVVSEEAAIVALERRELQTGRVGEIVAERERVFAALAAIDGVTPYPSRANFITFAIDGNPQPLFRSLLDAGVLVRDVSSYPLLENALRVSIGTSAENDRFLAQVAAAQVAAAYSRGSAAISQDSSREVRKQVAAAYSRGSAAVSQDSSREARKQVAAAYSRGSAAVSQDSSREVRKQVAAAYSRGSATVSQDSSREARKQVAAAYSRGSATVSQDSSREDCDVSPAPLVDNPESVTQSRGYKPRPLELRPLEPRPQGRTASIERTTKETSILLTLDLDGTGRSSIDTPVGFLSHMLEAVARHARIDLDVRATGDVEIDYHHTVEDVALVLGEAFAKALGDKRGIRRFGSAYVPLDESLARAVVDFSGRPFIVFDAPLDREMLLIHKDFPFALVEEFMKSFASRCACNLHIDLLRARNGHHAAEAIFKAFAVALREAKSVEGADVPSTKGVLE